MSPETPPEMPLDAPVASSDPAIDRMVADALDVARRLARRCRGRGVDEDDLISEANLALVEAAREYREPELVPEDDDGSSGPDGRYDPRRFRQWASMFVGRALRRLLRDAPFLYVAMPIRMRRKAARVAEAAACLAARGIQRPSVEQLAGEACLSVRTTELVMAIPGVIYRQATVEWAESRAFERLLADPPAVPIFPIVAFAPGSECPHNGPIHEGSVLCCMICHDTGQREHPALKRSKATDPKPEPRTKRPELPRRAGRGETRREKRRRLFPPRNPEGNPAR